MRGLFRKPWLFGLGVLVAVPLAHVAQVGAEVKTDSSGSMVIFPKVVSTQTRDTLIKITNRSNMPAQLHCYYVNASGLCSITQSACSGDADCAAVPVPQTCVASSCSIDQTECGIDDDCGPVALPQTCDDLRCQANNFDIFLTAQQPTMWRVSDGRLSDLASMAPSCNLGAPCGCSVVNGRLNCPGFPPTGSPGVLPAGSNFIGELKCYQTLDDFQTPVASNSIVGEAIIEQLITGQLSQYNAITITGNSDMVEGVNDDSDLELDWTGEGAGEYNRCPQTLVLNHLADNSVDADPLLNQTSFIQTELTLVPCSEVFESDDPQLQAGGVPARANVTIINEFEQLVASAPFNFDCALNASLSDIRSEFGAGIVGSRYAKTRLTPPSGSVCYTGARRGQTCTTDDDDEVTGCPGSSETAGGISLGCRPWPGLIGVAEQFYLPAPGAQFKPLGSTAAYNIHMEGQRSGAGDVVVAAELDTGAN